MTGVGIYIPILVEAFVFKNSQVRALLHNFFLSVFGL